MTQQPLPMVAGRVPRIHEFDSTRWWIGNASDPSANEYLKRDGTWGHSRGLTSGEEFFWPTREDAVAFCMEHADKAASEPCNHDQRFRDLFGATNGCCACEAEQQAKSAQALRERVKVLMHVLVGLNVIEQGSRKDAEGNAFVRHNLRLTLDQVADIEQETADYNATTTTFMQTMREAEQRAEAAEQQLAAVRVERDEVHVKWVVLGAMLDDERAKLTAAQAEIAKLREALAGLLISRDAAWEGGHDWQQALDKGIAALAQQQEQAQ